MEKLNLEKEGQLSGPIGKISRKKFTFDATQTLAVLRTIAKKRDAKLRTKVLKAYEDRIKKPPKEKPPTETAPVLSFRSSLPIRITPKALDAIKELKDKGATKVLFPHGLKEKSKVRILTKDDKTVDDYTGVVRTEVQTDPTKMSISDVGLFVDVSDDNPKVLEFIIRTPCPPAILRSSKMNDQGGLTHQLKMSLR